MKCTNDLGDTYSSFPIKFSHGRYTVELLIEYGIPFLVDKIEIIDDARYPYRENGISFMMNFKGLEYNVPLCKIESDENDPLTGNNDMAVTSKMLRNYGETLFFPAVPMEMLSTDA